MKRAVIKVGTNVLLKDGEPDKKYFDTLFKEIESLLKKEWECFLVLSGAVAAGADKKGLTRKQSAASLGQLEIVAVLHTSAQAHHVQPSLLLLSREDIVNRERYLSLQETLQEMVSTHIVPIINENDATNPSTQNDFTDNDHLSTILAVTMQADILILLTHTDGVYDKNPDTHNEAKLLGEIKNITSELIQQDKGVSIHGRGGMSGKLKAARLATAAGIPTYIAGAHLPNVLEKILLNGERVGTFCHPQHMRKEKVSNHDRWIMSAQHSGASVKIDAGAVKALLARKSLLAVGALSVDGDFEKGDSIEIVDTHGETLALGLASIDGQELKTLLLQEEKPFDIEVMHADNLILLT